MRLSTPRRSHARKPSSPFQAAQVQAAWFDHVASAVAFALLVASWAVIYVTVLPADPIPHRTHIALAQQPR